MGTNWLPWSAASLASGAIMLLLGVLMLPSAPDVAGLLASVEQNNGRWLMAAFAFFLAGGALTVGMPSVLTLLTQHPRSGIAAIVVWSMGAVGMAGYGALLILFRAVADQVHLTPADVAAIGQDPGIVAFVSVLFGCFYLAELWVALALLRARSVSILAPLLMLAHVASGLVREWLPDQHQGLTTILVTVALLIVAVQANETAAGRVSATSNGNSVARPVPRW